MHICNVIFHIFSSDRSIFFASKISITLRKLFSYYLFLTISIPNRILHGTQTTIVPIIAHLRNLSIFLRNNKNFSQPLTSKFYRTIYIYSIYFSVRKIVFSFIQFCQKRGQSASQQNACQNPFSGQPTLYRKLTSVIPTRDVINRNDRVVTRGGQLAALLRARWIPALISSSSSPPIITQLRLINLPQKSETSVEAVRLVVYQTIRGWRVKNDYIIFRPICYLRGSRASISSR